MRKISKMVVCVLLISALSFLKLNDSAKAATSFKGSTPLVDSYISVSNIVKDYSDGTVRVYYHVKIRNAGNTGVCIGYEWPSQYRLSDSTCVTVANTVGFHTLTIPRPRINIIGTQYVVAKFNKRYSESKSLGTFYNYPSGQVVTEYYTVSRANALAEYFVIGGLGVGVKFLKNNTIGFITKTLYAGFTTYYAFTSIGVVSGFPPKAVGQYYKVETWYSESGLHVKTTIWNNKEAFDRNLTPIYSGTQISKW
ncbi:hypothetical protein LYSIN_03454 [Lysinibacillus sphaericus]|uniref:Uncharacterized protein n=1 Tax=Lysinibacillus sphaericus TaxID=1421 RepID=A0A2S5CWN1_LYSSH|nr:hypothetical protein [Lysinibacillus sphaericus]POZ55157.1 hypothetical protein LYSIN_03454 [Lysinibacillus sphaericus]